MTFGSVKEICEFLIFQAKYIGYHILVPGQSKCKLSVDLTKFLPAGGKSGISQVHCSVDDKAQEFFLKCLLDRSPASKVVVEEDTPSVKEFPDKSGDCFFGDLLDGTFLYGANSPNFGVSLGYSKGGKMKVGVVYLPRLNLLLHAVEGEGAFSNGVQIKLPNCNAVIEGDSIILNSKIPLSVETVFQKNNLHTIRPYCSSFGLSLLLQNSAKSYIAVNSFVWDVAPFSIIISEAGWTARRFDGSDINFEEHNIVTDLICGPSEKYTSDLLSIYNTLKL